MAAPVAPAAVLACLVALAGAAAAAAHPQTQPPSAPVRVIVDDLVAQLQGSLAAQDVTLLLVLAGAAGEAALPLSLAPLEAAGVQVAVVKNVTELRAARELLQAAGKGLAARGGAGAGRAAVLVYAASPGRMSVRAGALLTSVSRRLGRQHVATVVYSIDAALGETLVYLSPRSGHPERLASKATLMHRDAFNKVYETKAWTEGGGGSGAGSELRWTEVIRRELPALVKRLGVRSMLDSSCGSMHWMPLVLANITAEQPGFRFMGTDVACSLIDRHTAAFADKPTWAFSCIDYAHQQLPSGYELVFSRDSLQHLPWHATWQYLNNVRASGAKYLLVGSYLEAEGPNFGGGGIKAGEYYYINLLAPPFSMKAPLQVIKEETYDKKHMLLFDMTSCSWDDQLLGLV